MFPSSSSSSSPSFSSSDSFSRQIEEANKLRLELGLPLIENTQIPSPPPPPPSSLSADEISSRLRQRQIQRLSHRLLHADDNDNDGDPIDSIPLTDVNSSSSSSSSPLSNLDWISSLKNKISQNEQNSNSLSPSIMESVTNALTKPFKRIISSLKTSSSSSPLHHHPSIDSLQAGQSAIITLADSSVLDDEIHHSSLVGKGKGKRKFESINVDIVEKKENPNDKPKESDSSSSLLSSVHLNQMEDTEDDPSSTPDISTQTVQFKKKKPSSLPSSSSSLFNSISSVTSSSSSPSSSSSSSLFSNLIENFRISTNYETAKSNSEKNTQLRIENDKLEEINKNLIKTSNPNVDIPMDEEEEENEVRRALEGARKIQNNNIPPYNPYNSSQTNSQISSDSSHDIKNNNGESENNLFPVVKSEHFLSPPSSVPSPSPSSSSFSDEEFTFNSTKQFISTIKMRENNAPSLHSSSTSPPLAATSTSSASLFKKKSKVQGTLSAENHHDNSHFSVKEEGEEGKASQERQHSSKVKKEHHEDDNIYDIQMNHFDTNHNNHNNNNPLHDDDNDNNAESDDDSDDDENSLFGFSDLTASVSASLRYAQSLNLFAPKGKGGRSHDIVIPIDSTNKYDKEKLDQYGRVIPQKEQFRQISEAFHGFGAGKRKREKRKKADLQQLEDGKRNSDQHAERQNKKMEEAQKNAGKAYIEL